MKIKIKHHQQDPRSRQTDRHRHLTLMAVQEKLGLFPKQDAAQGKPAQDYLKDKPLGLI
jgi:hypothetical protein